MKLKVEILNTRNSDSFLRIKIVQSEVEIKFAKQIDIPEHITKLGRPIIVGLDINHFIEYFESYDKDYKVSLYEIQRKLGTDFINITFNTNHFVIERNQLFEYVEAYDPSSIPKPDMNLGLTGSDIEGILFNLNKQESRDGALVQETGPCWRCSYQYSSLSYSHWYAGEYYMYYNTCFCSSMMGCGGHGYVQNGYCPKMQHGYPTVQISSWTNRWSLTVYTAQCSQCSYYVYYSY